MWGGGIEPCADCARSGIWWDKPVGNHSPDVPTIGTTVAPNCSQWLETFPPTSSQWGDVGRTPVPIGNLSWPRNLAVWRNPGPTKFPHVERVRPHEIPPSITMVLVVCWSIGELSWGRHSLTRDRNFRTWGNVVEPKVSRMGEFRGHGTLHSGSVARPTFSHWGDFGWGHVSHHWEQFGATASQLRDGLALGFLPAHPHQTPLQITSTPLEISPLINPPHSHPESHPHTKHFQVNRPPKLVILGCSIMLPVPGPGFRDRFVAGCGRKPSATRQKTAPNCSARKSGKFGTGSGGSGRGPARTEPKGSKSKHNGF